MTKIISYRVKIGVPTELRDREHMLSSGDSLLRAFEEVDRLVANSIGVELIHKRALREMGTAYFDYEVTLTLLWPVQLELGGSPNPVSISLVIERLHQILLESLSRDSTDASEFIDSWAKWAEKAGFADSFIYLAPSAERLQLFLDNFGRAARNLDVSIG